MHPMSVSRKLQLHELIVTNELKTKKDATWPIPRQSGERLVANK
jgi:hypothetical protein